MSCPFICLAPLETRHASIMERDMNCISWHSFTATSPTAIFPRQIANELHALATIFNEYVCLSRWIIDRYQLEPAGSHGVWGLEDHHHVIFVLGASQMIDNPDNLSPSDSLDPATVHEYSNKYIYFKCIENVMGPRRQPPSMSIPHCWQTSPTCMTGTLCTPDCSKCGKERC